MSGQVLISPSGIPCVKKSVTATRNLCDDNHDSIHVFIGHRIVFGCLLTSLVNVTFLPRYLSP